jgi:P-type Ca2+ transporter type 2C
MEFILVLLISLTLTYLVSWVFRKIGLPHILGHLTTGVILSVPSVSVYLFSDTESTRLFSSLANLGLIFLLFFIGLKIDLASLLKFSKRSINVSFLSAIIPFALGYLTGQVLGLDVVGSCVLGAVLSITAEAVSGALLEELQMLNTRIGVIIIEAGIIDDIFEILTLATVGTLIQSDFVGSGLGGVTDIITDIIIFIALIYLVRFLFIPTTFKLLGKSPSHSDLFTASFIIVLFMAAVSNYLQLGTVIGALIAGVIVKQTLLKEHKNEEEAEVVDMIETITFGFLEPIFFIWIAYTANMFENLHSGTFMIAVLITAMATSGKLIGSVLGTVLDKGTFKEGILIGWGMNARGAVELIAIKMAFDSGIVGVEIYTSVVFMTFVTTIISPIIFKGLVQYHKAHYLKT